MIKKIEISELKTGMYVCGLEKEGEGGPQFFMNNILMRTEEDIKKFRIGYKSVFIEIEEKPQPGGPRLIGLEDAAHGENTEGALGTLESVDDDHLPDGAPEGHTIGEQPEVPAGGTVVSRKPAAEAKNDDVDFYEELKDARNVRNEAEGIVRQFLKSARSGEDIDTQQVNRTVEKMVDSIFRNQDALTSLARLKSFDDYTFAHCVNVCILSVAIGRHTGLAKEALQDLGVGAILHDVGKVLVPENILKKPGALTDNEFQVMRTHAELGAEVLRSTKEISDESRYVASQHHEKYDGTGYPKKIGKDDIHLYARIGAVADVYDAMTSNRVYQHGMLPEEALKKMYLMREKNFDPEFVERLIRCLGIYPIGTLVELNTGETAIVRMANHTHPLQPVVLMVFDKDKKPFHSPFEIDLKDEIGRWIVRSKSSENLEAIIDNLVTEKAVYARA